MPSQTLLGICCAIAFVFCAWTVRRWARSLTTATIEATELTARSEQSEEEFRVADDMLERMEGTGR